MIVKRIVYSKGGHSMRNKVNLLIKLVSLKMKSEEGPAPGSTWMFFFLGWPPSKSAMVAGGHPSPWSGLAILLSEGVKPHK